MNKIFLLAVFLPFFSSGQQNIADKRLASLDTAFQRVLKTWKAPGFAVAVVEKNRIIYAKGFGYRDYDQKLPVTVNTLFPIGSCTKAFTTTLIGMLEKDGKVDIDKPAHNYLPELRFFSDDLTDNVTLRDMMSHRTGLPRHDYSWYLFGGSRDSLIRRIQYHEPTFPLRRQWQYNNFMFMAQGAIAEKITGKSWEENTRERILRPLEMTNTGFFINELSKQTDIALGYGLKKDSFIYRMPYFTLDAAGPAGSINSNVVEMSNWIITWINGGKFKGKEILPTSFMKEAMSSQSVIGSGFPSTEKPDIHFSNYGFGWFLNSYKGHYRVDHGGNIDGFSASTTFFPTDSIGIVVLVNQNGSAIPAIVRNLIADRLLKEPYFNWNDDQRRSYEKSLKQAQEAEKNKQSIRVAGTRPSHSLSAYEGIYTHPGYGSMNIYLQNDSLLAITNGRLLYLKHFHYDIFSVYLMNDERFDITDDSPIQLQFLTGLNGDIESFNAIGLEASAIRLNFTRQPIEKKLESSELQSLTGEYAISGVEIRVFLRDNRLRMVVPGQPEYELISTGDLKFSIKDLSGFSVQFIREGGRVTAINLIQPNGTFKAEKKQ